MEQFEFAEYMLKQVSLDDSYEDSMEVSDGKKESFFLSKTVSRKLRFRYWSNKSNFNLT